MDKYKANMGKKPLQIIACSLVCLLGGGGFKSSAQGLSHASTCSAGCSADKKRCVLDCRQ